jgi:thermitase
MTEGQSDAVRAQSREEILKTLLPNRYLAIVLAIFLASTAIPLPVSAETANDVDVVTETQGDWIIKLNEHWSSFQSADGVTRLMGDSTRHTLGSDTSTYVAKFDGETRASDAIARLKSHPAIDFVEPDIIYEYQEEFIPNDPGFDDQQWARTVNLPGAWSVTTGDPDVVVAVVDSGVRSDHPDLQGKVLPGKNYVEESPEHDTTDRIGHGTSVAGIIAATGNNGIGIAGTSMNVQILPLRVGSAEGARVSDIALAVEDAVDLGADIINLSLGSESQSARLELALTFAEANDVIVVAAAGNNADQVSFPGSSPSTISVGATTIDGTELAWFSSRISVTDLVAPGVAVFTTHYSEAEGNGYAVVGGTSFSTPIVTGTAALINSVNPDLDVHQVRSLLRETAQMTFAEGTAGTGAGLLDADAAVREALMPAYGATWLSADEPVSSLQAQRTWLWGPHAFDLRAEPYADAENGLRLVAYFDKARMEITNPHGDRTSPWFVTNGLLVNELISGQMQVGDNEFESRQPAEVPVAGDPVDNQGPTYASFSDLTEADTDVQGEVIVRTIARDGTVGSDEGYAQYTVTADQFIPETGHRIASVFWEYLNSTGTLRLPGQYVEGRIFNPTFFATGFPVTAAYWSQVTVGGVEQEVLIQCFERRCLTYTPENDPGWQVEMGNVGQHYYRWRYGDDPGGAVAQDPASYAMNNLR